MAALGSDIECSSSSFSGNEGDISSEDLYSVEERETGSLSVPLGILPYQFEPALSDEICDSSSSDDEVSQTDTENFAGLDVDDRAGTTDWYV